MTFKRLSLISVLKHIVSVKTWYAVSDWILDSRRRLASAWESLLKAAQQLKKPLSIQNCFISHHLIMSQTNNEDKKFSYEQSILLMCFWWCKIILWCVSSCLWRWRICYHLAAHHQGYSLQSLHICWGHVTWGGIAYPRLQVISHLSPCRPTASLHWAHTASLSF